MTDRTYRTLLGLVILISLYFDLEWLMFGVIGLIFFEGMSNLRIPKLVCKVRNCVTNEQYDYVNSGMVIDSGLTMEAEQVWRLLVACFLLLSYSFIGALWFFPWFLGFAILGAGLSGVCPVLLAISWIGFR